MNTYFETTKRLQKIDKEGLVGADVVFQSRHLKNLWIRHLIQWMNKEMKIKGDVENARVDFVTHLRKTEGCAFMGEYCRRIFREVKEIMGIESEFTDGSMANPEKYSMMVGMADERMDVEFDRVERECSDLWRFVIEENNKYLKRENRIYLPNNDNPRNAYKEASPRCETESLRG